MCCVARTSGRLLKYVYTLAAGQLSNLQGEEIWGGGKGSVGSHEERTANHSNTFQSNFSREIYRHKLRVVRSFTTLPQPHPHPSPLLSYPLPQKRLHPCTTKPYDFLLFIPPFALSLSPTSPHPFPSYTALPFKTYEEANLGSGTVYDMEFTSLYRFLYEKKNPWTGGVIMGKFFTEEEVGCCIPFFSCQE